MVRKILGIVLVLAAVGTALLGVKGSDSSGAKAAVESAAYITDGAVLPENEGKTVIVTGTVTAPLPFVDEQTGISIHSVVAYRRVEKASISLGSEGKPDLWVWGSTISKNDLGGSGKVVAPNVTIGEFAVAAELLQPIPTFKDRKEYSAEERAAMGWKTFTDQGRTYLYQKKHMPYVDDVVNYDSFGTEYLTSKQKNEGTLRVAYDEVEEGTSMEYTIVGVQKNGKLEKLPDVDMITTVAGHLTVEQMLEQVESNATTSLITALVIAAILAALGVFLLVKSFKKSA